MCRPGESETSFTGKLIASLTTCQSTSSGTSGVANGRTTRKHTSVNGSPRNSSSSPGECRAISTGKYKPPSGASPRSTAPRSEVSGALRDVLRYLKEFRSSRTSCLALNHFQEREGVQRSITQRGDMQGAMRERFITLAPRGNQRRITTRYRLAWFFSGLRLKRAAPQHRLGIVQISFDQELLLLRRRRQIHNGQLPAQTHQQIVPGVDDASRGIQHQGLFRLLLEAGQHFVQSADFLRKILCFALRVGGAVRPAHPGGDSVDSGEPFRSELWCELLLDAVIAGNRPIAVCS